jgi:hypothetical protein
MQRGVWPGRPAAIVAFACGASAGLGASRVLYEALFPRALWLGQLPAAAGLALLGGALAIGGWRWLATRHGAGAAVTPFIPFLLALLFVVTPTVQLARSRTLFALALWLVALLLLRLRVTARWPAALLLTVLVAGIYFLTLGRHVGHADTFEFQVTAHQLGIAHPTGYPLYLLLSKPFTWLPWGTIAMRVNLGTALFGVLAVLVLFLLLWRLSGYRVPAALAALAFALMPTFWSQAVEAEVYTLHNLIVALALLVMVNLLHQADGASRRLLALAALLGLGLANHLTTLLLLPAAVLVAFFVGRRAQWGMQHWLRLLPRLLLAALVPLVLYLYLPLRWAAVNGEPMGLARFVDWVVGGRFQGALQLRAWLQDPARYLVVGRLLLAEWQPVWPLLLALVGAAWLARSNWRVALLTFLTWAAFVFYALNYYVPDLNVFLLPAQLLLVLWWGLGLAALWDRLRARNGLLPATIGALLLATPLLVSAAGRWTQIDRSQPDERVTWAAGVLAQPLPDGAAVLADSEKFPPLYYLQQAEGIRPDLEISVLPDEAAYRADLGARLAAGQPVYLARFLPGLESQYHLRSAGPLLEVGTAPLASLPAPATKTELSFDGVHLAGYILEPQAAVDPSATALTLFWRADGPVAEPLHVYTRWSSDGPAQRPIPPGGQHPVDNYYPTVAWKPGELVADFHLLPHPAAGSLHQLNLQVALAPPFSPADALQWQTVTAVPLKPPQQLAGAAPLRVWAGPHYLDSILVPRQVRPGEPFTAHLSGLDESATTFPPQLVFLPASSPPPDARCSVRLNAPGKQVQAVWSTPLVAPDTNASYRLWLVMTECMETTTAPLALCGWLAPQPGICELAAIEVSGVALPAGATNFADKIALLDVEASKTILQPGGLLPVTLTWQGLAPLTADYTVFVQVVDEQDRIVGQVDSWPLQGTYPTSQWRPGVVVRDPYEIRLEPELPPGNYRLLVGWYLLATRQRLPVLDESGTPVEDRVVLPGFVVPETE